jgi:hypothetical protein
VRSQLEIFYKIDETNLIGGTKILFHNAILRLLKVY